MYLKRLLSIAAGIGAFALAACDKDPSAPTANFALTACPTGDLQVNSPISLDFTQGIQPSTVSGANIVVTDARTGVEVPGSLTLAPSGQQISFAPSAPLPFGAILSIRVQNLVNANGSTQLGVIVCNVRTQAAPITEVIWDRLDSPTGTNLTSASLFAPDSGWVSSFAVPLYRRIGTGWQVRFNQPYFLSSFDVRFISATHGWGAHFDQRRNRGVITQTLDGTTFDTSFTLASQDIRRLRIDSIAGTGNQIWGVAGGGTSTNVQLLKLDPVSRGWFATTNISGTSSIADIDHAPGDTTTLYAVSGGFRLGGSTPLIFSGRVFNSTNGGAAWAEVPNARADSTSTVVFRGVARRSNGDVYVAGGNGFFGRLPSGNAPYVKINLGVLSRDTTDYNALIFQDVQFAPDNDNIGWVVGAQLIGIQNGVPQYQGLIFGTTDGGTTWTRQGVRGADEYGAAFPALNRLDVWSSTQAWAVGDGGIVISLHP